MKQILWFRRDLRIEDSAILAKAKDEVLPIFIFDKNILSLLKKDDKRVSFIYKEVLILKEKLKKIGLDLAIFYDEPMNVFEKLKDFDEVLCSCDFEDYSIRRDNYIESIITMRRYSDSFLVKPWDSLKKDNTPYKVFTPFYNSLSVIWESSHIEEFKRNKNLKKIEFEYDNIPSLKQMGFINQELPSFLNKTSSEVLEEFLEKIDNYEKNRDFFSLDASSNLGIFLRFGLISPKQIFNKVRNSKSKNQEHFIRQLFWREFYNYILYHYPKSQFENFNKLDIHWKNNKEEFKRWCDGNTGVLIVDAAMRYFNKTGLMHNRLRMIVSSFLTKNLLIDWKWGEKYFASKLLDYEAASNIGSWQWAAGTGADAAPYFRVFNPYTQSAKFDKEAFFIKSVFKELKDVDPKLLHKENMEQNSLFFNHVNPIVSIDFSRKRVISEFKRAKNESI